MGTLSRRCFSLLVASFGLLRPCLLLSLPSGGGLNRIPAVVKPAEGHNIHLWLFEGDMEAQDMAVEKALSPSVSFNEPAADPYGIVLWPAALPVAALTATMIRKGKVKRVTELGAGTGLVSIAAVSAGAESVLSTDYNEEALALLSLAADLNLPRGGPRERLRSALYDVSSEDDNADNDSDATTRDMLAHCAGPGDLLVCADMLYSPSTSRAVARRCAEAVLRGASAIGGDTGRPGAPAFLEELRAIVAATCAQAAAAQEGGGEKGSYSVQRAAAAFAAAFPTTATDGGPVVEFRAVDAETIASPRNSLIATQHDAVKPLRVGLVEIMAQQPPSPPPAEEEQEQEEKGEGEREQNNK